MSMTAAIIRKDALELSRDRRLVVMALLVLALAMTAILSSYVRVSAYEANRAATLETDRGTWEAQGARNPHSAAHFAKWAFKPLTMGAVLDPGVTSYAGSAIWMEAHHQNPAVARPIDDQTLIATSGEFSVAWVLQVLMPLLIAVVAAGAAARERERGTLGLILASGGSAAGLLKAKLASVGMVTAVMAGSVIAIGMVAAASAGPGNPALLALWIGAYAAFLAIIVLVAVAVSLRARSSGQALLVLAGLWLLAVVLVPRAGASAAELAAPVPSAAQFWADIEAGKAAQANPFTDGQEAFAARIMAQYGVTRIEDLPVSFGGLQLEEDERIGNRVFDAYFGRLYALYGSQRAVLRWSNLLSPLPALQNISMGLSGTDMPQQIAFQQQAETRRRAMVTELNTDLIEHGAGADFDYVADPQLWEQVADFRYTPPSSGAVLGSLWPDALILLGWLAVAGGFAAGSVRRLLPEGQ
jgi:ABC-2 type transport system permease protein